jgi:hypothetical protein
VKQRRALNIVFPNGGLNRRFAFQDQPPFTTPSCVNVVPKHAGATVTSAMQKRVRGGSRPGLQSSHLSPEGGSFDAGGPIRLLTALRPLRNVQQLSWIDGFVREEPASIWVAAPWADEVFGIWPDDPEDVTFESLRGAMRRPPEDFDSSRPYSIEVEISPHNDSFHGEYSLAALAGDDYDATENGIIATLVMLSDDGSFTGELAHYRNGVHVGDSPIAFDVSGSPIAEDPLDPGAFKLLVDGFRVRCYWKDLELLDVTLDDTEPVAGHNLGFTLKATQPDGGVCFYDWILLSYLPDISQALENQVYLVASAEGALFVETDDLTSFREVETELTLATGRTLLAVEYNGNLYIADHEPIKAQGSGDVSTNGLELTNDDGFSWLDAGASVNDDVLVITNGQGNVTGGNYELAAVAADFLTFTRSAEGSGTCEFRLERGLKVYKPNSNTLELWKSENFTEDDTADEELLDTPKGAVPQGCSIICVCFDRIWLAGSESSPLAFFACRQGNPLDWEFFPEDPTDEGAAFASPIGKAGQPDGPITAMASHTDLYMVLSTKRTLWKLSGDPGAGGVLINVSRKAGIISKKAWCYGLSGELYFLSFAGMCVIPPGADGYPTFLGAQIPEAFSLEDLDRDQYEAFLEYDPNLKMVHVYFVKSDDEPEAFAVAPVQTLSSLTRTGGTATGTTPEVHKLRVGQKVTISGAGQAAYNGTHTVLTTPTGTTFTFAVTGEPATPATGTIVGTPVVVESANGVATVWLTNDDAHRMRNGRRVDVSGLTPAGYNGNFEITQNGAFSFTYRVPRGIAAVATGTAAIKPAGIHFWWDAEMQRWWSITLPLSLEPTSVFSVDSRFGTDSPVYLGTRSGAVCAFRDAFEQDGGGVNISSKIVLGPFGDRDGGSVMLSMLSAVLGVGSGTVTWTLHPGDSPEEAFEAQAFRTGTWEEGKNFSGRPRMRARAFWLTLEGNGHDPWSMESVEMEIEKQGEEFRRIRA